MASSSSIVGKEREDLKMSVIEQFRGTFRDDALCKFIIPLAGCFSYELFSLNVMNPWQFSRTLAPYGLITANSLWLNAHLGIGIYFYTREHLVNTTSQNRILYSVFGTVIFNFGSVLIWATCKSLLPDNPLFRTIFGLVSGAGCLCLGKEYLNYIDQLQKKVQSQV